MRLHHQRGLGHTLGAKSDRRGSTNSAVSDTTQDALHLARSQLSIDHCHGSESAKGTIRTLEPTFCALMVAEVFISNSDNPSQAVKPVGFVRREPSTAPSALQASRREVEGAGEFFQCQTGSSHQLFHHGRSKSFPDRIAHIVVTGENASERVLAAQFSYYGPKFVYHSVAYGNAKWHEGQETRSEIQFGLAWAF